MKFSEMKMTVTLDEDDIKEIIAQAVANEIGRAVLTSDVKINVGTISRGDQRDSWDEAVFKNITVELIGKV
jgi:hypothetical protein